MGVTHSTIYWHQWALPTFFFIYIYFRIRPTYLRTIRRSVFGTNHSRSVFHIVSGKKYHAAVWNNNKMSWGWRKFFPMMIASVNVDQIPNVLSTLYCTSSCSSTSKAVSYSVEAYIQIICPTPDVNYSGFNGLMWLQLQQMAQLIFLGSFRLNSNHNYFPIAVVAQTLGILGRSTPIIKEKALFFKTDIRISKKKADCVFTSNQKE